jgi:hypothetical protein
VAAAGVVDHDDLARVVGRVEECVRDARWQVAERPFAAVECLSADPDLVLASKDVNRFLLFVVDVKRRTASWCDLDDEVVEGAAGLLPRDLEDEVASWAGLESQSFVWPEDLCLGPVFSDDA